MELSLDRLTKQYGRKIAVDCVSATLKPGVYGLLGANGAGKTTLMRSLLCKVYNKRRVFRSVDIIFNNFIGISCYLGLFYRY